MHTSFVKIKYFLVLFSVFMSLPSFANTPEQIRNLDIRSYNPKTEGLRDLVFEVRYSDLKETVAERLSLDNIIDLYFRVYWMTPGRFKVQVAGLPDGFEELKAELRAMLRSRLELVIPEDMASRLSGYQLRTQNIDGGTQVIGEDPTHSKAVNRLSLNFDNEGRLTRLQTQSPMGTNTTHVQMRPKSWSNNKWVTDQIKVRTVQGIQMTEVVQDISYESVDGFGFPSEIKIKTTQKLVRPEGDDGETFEASSEATVTFSNYIVNSGAARQMILQNP